MSENETPDPHWGHDRHGRFQYVDYDEERLIVYPAQGGGVWMDKRGEGPVFVRQEDVAVIISALQSASLKPSRDAV